MKSKHFLGLCLVVGGFGAAGFTTTGCGGSGTGGSGGGTGGSTSAASSSSHSASHSASGPSSVNSSGTGGGAANATCDTAADLKLDGKDNPGSLPKPDTDYRWYKFTLKKGDPFFAFTTAKTGKDPFDPTYIDTVITLYSGDCKTQTQIAQNDDPYPRFTNDSELITTAPADGTYYLRVAECNGVFAMGCASSAMIKTFDFTIAGGVLNTAAMNIAAEGPEPNDTVATATDITMKYAPGMTKGSYIETFILGAFQASAADVDVYKFQLPADLKVDPLAERSVANFYPQPSGTNYDGAALPIGKLLIVDGSNPMMPVTIAQIDMGAGQTQEFNREISPPIKLGVPYYFFVQSPGGAGTPADFYVLKHYGTGSNPLEKADATNGNIATPEVLTESANQPGTFFVDGDISAAADVDYYSLTIPAGLMKNTVDVACGAQRIGSGVRGLTAEFLKGSAGNGSLQKPTTETAAADLQIQGLAIPAGETKLLLKISATANPPQDPMVQSTFYRCGVYFN